MNWKGKLIGLLLGLLTRRPLLILVGLVLGHLYDMGVFAAKSGPAASSTPPALDPYATLGVDPSASDEEIEQAYRRGMSEYHPDRVGNAAKEIRDLAGRRASEINGAYEEIKRQRGL
ncbi:MAG: DnaJ domain-containing protein [Arenimonas sp.]|nr:DnaJ domain-containing protein [Arenimonas sp.]